MCKIDEVTLTDIFFSGHCRYLILCFPAAVFKRPCCLLTSIRYS